jgi:CheY-like chemotaxis protein
MLETHPLTSVAPGAPTTILVVDDDALIAMNTVDMLESLGHRVLEANSGREALAIIERGETVDAILTDYAMPGMTGVELATRARLLRPGLPVVLATGYSQLPDEGGDDLPRLPKPFDETRLRDTMVQLFAAKGMSAIG